MAISQKCHYALRALFELAKRYGEGTCKVSEIAAAQGIPARFLEVILGELKQGGFVESRRGKEGGYMLTKEPQLISVGEVICFVQRAATYYDANLNDSTGDHDSREVFEQLWTRANRAVAEVFDNTTLATLVDQQARLTVKSSDFAI